MGVLRRDWGAFKGSFCGLQRSFALENKGVVMLLRAIFCVQHLQFRVQYLGHRKTEEQVAYTRRTRGCGARVDKK